MGSSDHESRDAHGWYAKSVAAVHKHIATLEMEDRIPPERIMIVGVSQGAALAAEAALTLRVELAGWVMISGWLMPRARTALRRSLNAKGSRVLVCHSTADEEVAFSCALLTQKLLEGIGAAIEFESYEGARPMLHMPPHTAASPYRLIPLHPIESHSFLPHDPSRAEAC